MSLYALCDMEMLRSKSVTLSDFVRKAKEAKGEILQYRHKSADIATVKKDLLLLRQMWDKLLIINDYYELSNLCDGIHIGQEDLVAIDPDPLQAIEKLKTRIGEGKMIGLSTHNKEEIEIANTLDLDYIGLGAYRATSTKSEAKVLGESLDTLAKLSVHPVAAIGGVKLKDTFTYVTYKVIGSGLL